MKKRRIRVQLNRRDRGIRLYPDGTVELLLSKQHEIKEAKRVRIVTRGFDRPSRKANLLDRIHENRKILIKVLAAVVAVMVIVAVVGALIGNIRPYAFELAGKEICYVRGSDKADEVRNKLLEEYIPEDSTIVAVDSGQMIKIDKADSFIVGMGKSQSVEEAVETIKTALEENTDEDIQITIASSKTEVVPYTPEPNYKKDKTMLAGESKVVSKGKKGTAEVTTMYYTVNGYIVGKEETRQNVLDEGEPATIKKGILGLPEGEDWKTYDGDPVFKDGTELAVTSLHYLGAPYKYGGYSLTNGIDCVQFVRAMYKKYGIYLPNGHRAIQNYGTSVSLKNAKKGDIVCYNHHMGIYIGNGKIVNAVRKGVSVSSVTSRKIVTIRRVVK